MMVTIEDLIRLATLLSVLEVSTLVTLASYNMLLPAFVTEKRVCLSIYKFLHISG